MWRVINRTPYETGHTWSRDKEGVHEWIVCVKATFDVKPDGTVRLADEQAQPLIAPEYNGEPGHSSLRYDADLVSTKPTTDVLLNATAYAPKGKSSTNFFVSLRIAQISKVIHVFGDRVWGGGPIAGGPSTPQPVVQIPIVYERAYGGYAHADPDPRHHKLDSRNPVGRGVAADAYDRTGQPAPNFEYPYGSLERAGPAGFGAIDSHWSPRRELTGTFNKKWEQDRRPLLPEDWSPHALLCSPSDQRPQHHLRGGEAVELINLTPTGLLRFFLPKVYLTFRTRFSTRTGRRTEEHRSQLASVIIEPDHPRVCMVWQTSVLCHTDVDYLEETIVEEKRYL